ncbi:hypothetical protein J6590_063420 [Homalodisca vitripennis]|nr:hypothetical protein J6590_063420 [Homalodisca vitripennis]
MEQMVEDLEVDTNVMIFRVKLFLARTELNEAMSRTQFQMATEPPVKDVKLDVTDLPTRVLKHLITSGIVRGKIFELSDAFACLSCNPELQAKFPGKRNAFIYIKGPHHQSLLLAVDTVEMLLDEVVKRNTGPVSKVPALERYWSEMREVDYEIKDFPVAAIKNVISRGIIRGKVNEFSGAVVSARGNPHLSNPPQNDRTLYLHIQAPDHHSILREFPYRASIYLLRSSGTTAADIRCKKYNLTAEANRSRLSKDFKGSGREFHKRQADTTNDLLKTVVLWWGIRNVDEPVRVFLTPSSIAMNSKSFVKYFGNPVLRIEKIAIQAINRLLHEVAPDESSPPGEMLTNNSGSQATMVKQPVSNSSTLTELPAVSTASPSESMEVTEQTAVATEQTSLSDVIRQLQQYIKGSENSGIAAQPATVCTTPQPIMNDEQLKLDVPVVQLPATTIHNNIGIELDNTPSEGSGGQVLNYNLYVPFKYKKELLRQKKEAEGTWIPSNN